MKFAIYGVGGVGGYLGVRLVQAGHEVGFVARGKNLAALRERGLSLTSPLGNAQTGPLRASDDPAALGVADAVIVTTKLYDLAAAAERMRPLVGPNTLVVPVQNGVEARDLLVSALPPEAVLKATIYIASFLLAPGEISHRSNFCRLRFAAAAGYDRPEVAALAAALNAAPGVEAAVSPNIDLDLWRKLVMLASFSAVACVKRQPVGPVLDDPETFALFRQALAETVAVGRAEGVALPDDIEAATIAQMRQFPANAKPSMLEDLEAGRPVELDYLSGAVVRLGLKHGVPTPFHTSAYAQLSGAVRRP
ncbi:MAG: 2-dehydropantoate 2-reductase [Rhodospirillaceae bacterium]|nr:2-dehydropantoate 2-reductase [Rhodospirillaceae bacterium]